MSDMKDRPLWSDDKTYEDVEHLASENSSRVIYNLHEDVLCLKEDINNHPSPCVNLSMEQIKSIAEFAGFAVNTFDYSDDEMKNTEFVISTSEKVDNEDGTYYEGMTVHCAEYPEEGFLTLEDTAPLPTPPTQED